MDEIEELLQVWMHYDPFAKGFIKQEDLIFFFLELPVRFQLRNEETSENFDKEWRERRLKNFKPEQLITHKERNIQVSTYDALRIMKMVQMSVYEGEKVHFKDVYKKLVKLIIVRW